MDKDFAFRILGEPHPELERLVELKVTECLATLQPYFVAELKRPAIKYDLKGRTAGMAMPDGSIRLNLELLNNNTDDMIGDTVPHEVAHVVQRQFYPVSKSHGKEWARIMGMLNRPAVRCHQYETTPARKPVAKPYAYQCDCKTHMVSRTLHTRIQQGRTYRCTTCKGALR